MNSAPLWLTVVLAAITSGSTLIAGGLTTWLTLRYANKRLALEQAHQSMQDNHKLHYEHRLEAYTEAIKTLEAIKDYFFENADPKPFISSLAKLDALKKQLDDTFDVIQILSGGKVSDAMLGVRQRISIAQMVAIASTHDEQKLTYETITIYRNEIIAYRDLILAAIKEELGV
ncbi:hypothetical protein [Amycolatopsis sp. NPDC003731]